MERQKKLHIRQGPGDQIGVSSINMLDWLIRLVFPPVFVIEIKDGTAAGRKGELPGAILGDFSDVARQFEIRGGRIYGARGRGGIVLEFSRDIPIESYQRFRNVFGTYRHRFKA